MLVILFKFIILFIFSAGYDPEPPKKVPNSVGKGYNNHDDFYADIDNFLDSQPENIKIVYVNITARNGYSSCYVTYCRDIFNVGKWRKLGR